MTAVTELDAAIRTQIALLPLVFPYAISIAGPADSADILTLAADHGAGQPNVCDWAPVITGGTATIDQLRLTRIIVLLRDKTGSHTLRALVAYAPPEKVADDAGVFPSYCWLTAIAATTTKTRATQLRYIWAINLPVHRALLSLGYAKLVTVNFPLDARMKAFTDPMRTTAVLTVQEHRLDGTGNVTHASFVEDLAASLAKYEVMF